MNLFEPQTSPFETILRVLIVYLFLLFLVRAMGKKEIGRLSAMELLTILLLARTVAPAMTTNDPSLTTAGISAATLVGIAIVIDRLVYRSKRIERFVQGRPRAIIEQGRVLTDSLAEEHLTEQQLLSAVRAENLADLAEVEAAYLEPSGRISVIPKSR